MKGVKIRFPLHLETDAKGKECIDMKATDIVNKVELDVTYDSLIELMRAGRQVDFVLPAPETDGDGYLSCATPPPTTSTTCRTTLSRRRQRRFASANPGIFPQNPQGERPKMAVRLFCTAFKICLKLCYTEYTSLVYTVDTVKGKEDAGPTNSSDRNFFFDIFFLRRFFFEK